MSTKRNDATNDAPRTLTDSDKAAVKRAFDALRATPGFKTRGSQNRMIAMVARALGTTGGGALVEAPTGVGKSLGYLTAGVPIALAHKRALIIGTGTVALQEQLVNRDIPRFLKATGLEATVALAKGRGRYACLRNLAEAAGGQGEMDLGAEFEGATVRPPSKTEAALVDKLFEEFDAGRWNGDLDVVAEPIPEGVRKRITTTSGGCNRANCAFANDCPYLLARKASREAQIVVANHDYILAALQVPLNENGEHPLLPLPSESLFVFDEGHNLPEKAIDCGAAHVHLPTHIQALERARTPLASAYNLLGNEKIAGVTPLDAQRAVGDAIAAVRQAQALLQAAWTPDPNEREPLWRAPHGKIDPAWQDLAATVHGIEAMLLRVVDALVAKVGAKEEKGGPGKTEKVGRTLGRFMDALEEAVGLWKAWADADAPLAPPKARWLTAGRDGGMICHASPISGAQFLTNALWSGVEAAVVCSATLSMGGDFDHFCEAAAIPDNWEIASLPTPFNLAENAVLEIPKMRATPKDADAHTREVTEWIENSLDWNAGNLVLFASRRQMEQVVQSIPQNLAIKTLVQGSRSRTELLDMHAKRVAAGTGSTIFGLAGFGEGVDLAGDLATTVVIAKLPFATPSAPVGATKSEWYEKRGRSPFFEIAIPDVQRVLTQFMGRLIRTESDKGRIVLMDRRLVTARYGKTLLESLPPYRRAIA